VFTQTTDNTMVTRTNYDVENTTQTTDNIMVKTTDNTMVTRTNYDVQNTTQTTDNTIVTSDKL
jgi:hypothetical protein